MNEDQANIDIEELPSFYSHLSRVYTSGLNALIASIFGWFAYCYFSIQFCNSVQIENNIIFLKAILIVAGITIFLIIAYFHLRALFLGRVMYDIENTLNLRDYINTIPHFLIFPIISTRKNDKSFTYSEIISLFILLLIGIVTFYIIWQILIYTPSAFIILES